MRLRIAAALAALALCAAPAANAQLWYNGDPDDVNGWSSELNPNWNPNSMVFDYFTVPSGGWTITSLFGNFITTGLDADPTQAIWEIRSGMSAGNGGTLLYSGTDAMSWVTNGFGFSGYVGYLGTVTGFSPFSLLSGGYWMGISVIHGGPNQVFAATTGGANGVGEIIDDSSLQNFPLFNYDYADTGENISYGLDGRLNTVVPEPATMVLLASGLVGLGVVQVRRRRRD